MSLCLCARLLLNHAKIAEGITMKFGTGTAGEAIGKS